jgi:superfamily II DNA or RNA helicase
MMNIDINKIKQSYNSVTFSRGHAYYCDGRVKSTTLDASLNSYDASVSGSGKRTYFLSVFEKEGKLTSVCSCPVGYQCKHGVAAALTIINADKKGEEKKSSPLVMTPNNKVVEISKKVVPPKRVQTTINRPLIVKNEFASWLDKTTQEIDTFSDKTNTSEHVLHYILNGVYDDLHIEIKQPKQLKTGLLSQGRRISMRQIAEIGYGYTDHHMSDVMIADNIDQNYYAQRYDYILDESSKYQVLFQMIETGRCHWQDINSEAFHLNTANSLLSFRWTDKPPYKLSLLIDNNPLSMLLNMRPLGHIDIENREASYIDTKLHYSLIKRFQALPALRESEVIEFIFWARDLNVMISPPSGITINTIEADFLPMLTIDHDGKHFLAQYHFSYGDFNCAYGQYPLQAQMAVEINKQTFSLQRDLEKEQQALDLLFEQAKFDVHNELLDNHLQPVFRQNDPYFWASFTDVLLPDLLEKGWIVDIKSTIPLPKVIDVQEMQGEINSDDYADWFQLGLSIELDGKKVDLVPLLMSALATVNDWHALPDLLCIPYQGNFLNINKEKLLPIIKILQQLTDDKGWIPKFHASVINDIPFVNEWTGDKKIHQLADKLANFEGVEVVATPNNLQAQLREYQQHGLNWLNFLQEYGFGGILADDMGLGKTVQALAMMQSLFERKQLKQPILVICPTSLVSNWRNEATKFTPDLNVLVLHGPDRKTLFTKVHEQHLVITTYPLVHRDFEALSQFDWQWLILDEAQVIKNPKAKMTQSVKQLKAQHKVCLTGTPMENHLGELWSLFDFLMPGYLSNHKGFNDLYRKPIENGEHYAQEWLNKRIAPFLLRRTKDAVATELPAKTEIIQSLQLPKDQRILYESIRVTMEKKVRDLLKQKGIAKSQIEFLDALLKLRQACCHPKLVKLESAESVSGSAKLEFLLEVLPEMLEEGRKILIFSQFTQMLQLIETALHEANIKTTKLTGKTRKREEAINKFTSGQVDVFLISLKAGGVGLNLTEADTVIHFDPWWNPATENQATDRAYRIGQDKPVFVYKLVTENTIEERVLELQRNKQAMADSVYGSKAQQQKSEMSNMDANQLLSLFE